MQIKLKNSVVQDSAPSASDLPEVGELAVNGNINSIGGFMRASDNSIVKIFGPGSVSTPTATTTVSGIAELATSAETTTGSATNRVVTPAGLNAVTVAERSTSNSTYLAVAGGTLTGVVAATAGSNSAPSIHFGDSDSGIFGGTNTVSLAAGGTTRLTADTGVSVVGTLAVTGAITSTSDLTIADKIIHAGDTDTAVRFPAANAVSVETGGNEALRIDSSQRLLVGHSSSINSDGISSSLQISGTGGDDSSLFISRFSANISNPNLVFAKSRNATVGSNTIVQSGDILGGIQFHGNDGSGFHQAASIVSKVESGVDSNDMPGSLVFSTTADGAVSPTTRLTIDSAGLVKLPDNGKFVAGAGNDLQIYHDGTNSYINDSGTGSLRYLSNTHYFSNAALSEVQAQFIENGAVELYYDNVKHFETNSAGLNFCGSNVDQMQWQKSNNLLKFRDGTKSIFGEGNDLQIYHNGTNSILSNTTGALKFLLNNDEDAIVANQNGAVELYHNNALRFQTDSNGCTVLGTRMQHMDNTKAQFGTGGDLQIYHNGTDSFIDNDNGNFAIRTTVATHISLKTNNENAVFCQANAGVSLYFNNVKHFETLSYGAAVTGIFTSTGDIKTMNDTAKFVSGASDDLQIYHDGTNSFIKDTGTGNLVLATSELSVNNAASNEEMIKASQNGVVELFFDNSKKAYTFSNGFAITANLSMVDNGKAVFGSGNDLEIYHSTANNIIECGNGMQLHINKGDTENMAKFIPDGAVELYFDNSKKIETTSNGVTVSGRLDTQGLFTGDNHKILVGNNDDLQIFHDGSNSYIKEAGTGNVIFEVADATIEFKKGGSEHIAKFIPDGGVELYYNNVKRFETTNEGVLIENGGTSNVSVELHNSGSGRGNQIRFRNDHQNNTYIGLAGDTTGDLLIYNEAAVKINHGADAAIKTLVNGAVELYYDGQKKFETTTNGIQMTGDIRFNNSTWTGETTNGKIQTHGNHMYLQTAGSSWFFRKNDGTTAASINNAGAYTQSDITLKKDVVTISNSVNTIKQLTGRSFTWKEDDKKSFGVIAQEIETILPELITSTVEPEGSTVEPKKMVNYTALTGHFIEAIKELITKIETLETKVAALEAA